MQSEHKVCIFFTPPQAGHLFNDVTSFRAFPAICRCLFFMCDVFFLGTARSIPSHMSPSRDGIFEMAAGMAIASSVTDGSLDSCAYCVYRAVDRKEDWKLVDAILGKREGKNEAIRSCWRAAMIDDFNRRINRCLSERRSNKWSFFLGSSAGELPCAKKKKKKNGNYCARL